MKVLDPHAPRLARLAADGWGFAAGMLAGVLAFVQFGLYLFALDDYARDGVTRPPTRYGQLYAAWSLSACTVVLVFFCVCVWVSWSRHSLLSPLSTADYGRVEYGDCMADWCELPEVLREASRPLAEAHWRVLVAWANGGGDEVRPLLARTSVDLHRVCEAHWEAEARRQRALLDGDADGKALADALVEALQGFETPR